MNRLTRLAGATLALIPVTASADVRTYYHNGAWEAFSGRVENGGAVCGINSTGDARRLSLRVTIGAPETAFTVSKPDWSIPDNTRITVVLQVGLNAPWVFGGNGHGHDIDWSLDQGPAKNFEQQFRTSPSFTVAFPSGTEPPWVLALTGSTAISDTYARCIRDLTRQVQTETPPAAAAPAETTQPFAAPPR